MTRVWEDDPCCHMEGQGDWEEEIALPVGFYIGANDALHNDVCVKAAMRLAQGSLHLLCAHAVGLKAFAARARRMSAGSAVASLAGKKGWLVLEPPLLGLFQQEIAEGLQAGRTA